MIFVVGACAEAGGHTQLPALNHPVTVTFWHAMAGINQKPALEALTQKFNASQRQVTVNLQVYDTYETLKNRMLAAAAAGRPPDLSECNPSLAAELSRRKALADLEPYIQARDGLPAADLGDFWPVLLQEGGAVGHQGSFPFSKSTPVLYYNLGMFKAAGIAAPPQTWDEFSSDALKLAQGGRWGADFSQASVYEVVWESMVQEFGGTLLDRSGRRATFSSEAGRAAIQVFATLAAAGAVHRVQGFGDEDDFGAERTAMIFQPGAALASVARNVGGRFEVGTAPLPSGPRGRHAELSGSNLCVSARSPRDVEQGAFQFIKYLTAEPNTAAWARETGTVPVRQSAYRSMKDDFYRQNPAEKPAVDQLSTALPAPAAPGWDDAGSAILLELVNIVDRKRTAREALDLAAARVDTLLKAS